MEDMIRELALMDYVVSNLCAGFFEPFEELPPERDSTGARKKAPVSLSTSADLIPPALQRRSEVVLDGQCRLPGLDEKIEGFVHVIAVARPARGSNETDDHTLHSRPLALVTSVGHIFIQRGVPFR